MNTLNDRARDARERLAQALVSEPPTFDAVRRTARRRRTRSRSPWPSSSSSQSAATIVATASHNRTAVVAGPATGVDRLAGLQQPGMWSPLPPAPIAGRSDGAGVWTGSEFVIWGGTTGAQQTEQDIADGAAYNPVTAKWRMLASSPLSPRANPATVWTGSELVIWGGGANGTPLNDGAAYDPIKDAWRAIASSPIPGGIRPATVWTGTEMIVLGGLNGGSNAAAYNPATNEWRAITGAPGGIAPPYPQAVWTGQLAAFVVTIDAAAGSEDIATYDPSTDRWTVLPASGVQQARLFWTGNQLLAIDPTHDARSKVFDTAQQAWHPIAVTPATATASPEQVWTGTTALFWGLPQDQAKPNPTAAIFDPRSGTWDFSVPFAPLRTRVDGMIVWADGVMLAWGGFANAPDGSAIGLDDGAIYRPPNPPTTNATATTAAQSPTSALAGDPLVACGSHPYPASALDGPTGVETAQDPPALALRNAIDHARRRDPHHRMEAPSRRRHHGGVRCQPSERELEARRDL